MVKNLDYYQIETHTVQKDKIGSTEKCQNVSYALLPLDGRCRLVKRYNTDNCEVFMFIMQAATIYHRIFVIRQKSQ